MSILSNEKSEASSLNKCLRGIYMGIDTFKKFEEDCEAENLKQIYGEIICLYDKHKSIISSKITSLQQEPPVTGVGTIGTVSEFFYDFKTIFVDTDPEILEESKKAFNQGVTMFEKFIDDNKKILSEDSIDILRNILNENKKTGTKLNNISIA